MLSGRIIQHITSQGDIQITLPDTAHYLAALVTGHSRKLICRLYVFTLAGFE